MPSDELAGHENPDGGLADGPGRASGEPSGDDGTSGPGVTRSRPARGAARGAARYLHGTTGRWLAIFGVSLGLLLVRFLVPAPVGQADNRDGPRLMCGLGLAKVVPPGRPTFFRYAYFEYLTSPDCAGRTPYPSSEIVPLEVARGLTPVFGLPGDLNLIALGVLMCILTSVAIASLATGLRIRLWAQLLVAAAVWLIIADSAFFDVFASPFSEASALVGLLLVAAGVLYLRRGWRETVFGLVLAGSGGFLAILSKEQYMVLALPICVTLVLATSGRGQWRGLRRFRNREATAGVLVAAGLALMAGVYALWDYTSRYGQRLHHIQAVNMIFTDIVTKRSAAPAQLRALGLPVSWAKYAGHYYWDKISIRLSPLYPHYVDKLTDQNIVHYLLTHPRYILSVGQSAAIFAQQFRITQLGDYPISAGHPKGAYESRVVVVTWLIHQLPAGLGLWLYVPLWIAMSGIGLIALYLGRARAWHRGRRGPRALHDRVRVRGVHPARLLRRDLHHQAHGGSEPGHRARLHDQCGAGHLADPAGPDPGPAAGSPGHQGRGRARARWPRSVRDRDDNVGRLDHRYHLTALGQAEFTGRLDRDGGDQPDAVRVQDDVGGGLTGRDAGDRRPDLVARAELHVRSPFVIMPPARTGICPARRRQSIGPPWQAREYGKRAGQPGRERGL